ISVLARLLLALGAVLAAALLAILGAGGVERAADHVIADTGEVANAAPTDEHDRVLLQVVADARDVGGDLDLRGQTDTGHLAERRVGLLGRGRVHANADATPLRASPKRAGLGLVCRLGAALADQLLKGRHDRPFIENVRPATKQRARIRGKLVERSESLPEVEFTRQTAGHAVTL